MVGGGRTASSSLPHSGWCRGSLVSTQNHTIPRHNRTHWSSSPSTNPEGMVECDFQHFQCGDSWHLTNWSLWKWGAGIQTPRTHDWIIVLYAVCCIGLSRWLSSKEFSCQCRRCELDPWLGKIPWKRKWQATPIFLPGKCHGQRNLAGYSPWDCRVGYDWVTEQ